MTGENKQNLKTRRITLSGRVQGVGFRYFAENKAHEHNINGYVRNTPDNAVEIVCQAGHEKLEKFFKEIKKGPAFAKVISFNIEELDNSIIYETFNVRY